MDHHALNIIVVARSANDETTRDGRDVDVSRKYRVSERDTRQSVDRPA